MLRLETRRENGVRTSSVLRSVLGLERSVVIGPFELVEPVSDGGRPTLVVSVRTRARRRGRCGRCGAVAPFYD